MKKVDSVKQHQTERAIIDALLKISDIIKKTTKINQYSKGSIGDGDRKQRSCDCEVPIPPPMRTLESYISSFRKQCGMSSSNCNRAPVLPWYPRPSYERRFYPEMKTRRINEDSRDRLSTRKRRRYQNPSIFSDYRKKSSRYHSKGSDKRRGMKCPCHTSYENNQYTASDC